MNKKVGFQVGRSWGVGANTALFDLINELKVKKNPLFSYVAGMVLLFVVFSCAGRKETIKNPAFTQPGINSQKVKERTTPDMDPRTNFLSTVIYQQEWGEENGGYELNIAGLDGRFLGPILSCVDRSENIYIGDMDKEHVVKISNNKIKVEYKDVSSVKGVVDYSDQNIYFSRGQYLNWGIRKFQIDGKYVDSFVTKNEFTTRESVFISKKTGEKLEGALNHIWIGKAIQDDLSLNSDVSREFKHYNNTNGKLYGVSYNHDGQKYSYIITNKYCKTSDVFPPDLMYIDDKGRLFLLFRNDFYESKWIVSRGKNIGKYFLVYDKSGKQIADIPLAYHEFTVSTFDTCVDEIDITPSGILYELYPDKNGYKVIRHLLKDDINE